MSTFNSMERDNEASLKPWPQELIKGYINLVKVARKKGIKCSYTIRKDALGIIKGSDNFYYEHNFHSTSSLLGDNYDSFRFHSTEFCAITIVAFMLLQKHGYIIRWTTESYEDGLGWKLAREISNEIGLDYTKYLPIDMNGASGFLWGKYAK